MTADENASKVHMPYGVAAVVRAIDRVGEWSGKVFSWLVFPMALSIAYAVVSRYIFDRPTMWVSDTTWMLYGTHFMIGAAYTLYRNGHIRTDLLYIQWSQRKQALFDLFFYVVFFFPGMVFFFIASLHRTIEAWSIFEVSNYTPMRFPLYPVVTVMPVSILLLLVQGVSEVIRCIYKIKGKDTYAS